MDKETTIKVSTRTTEEEALALKSIVGSISKLKGVTKASFSAQRKCDGCNKHIKTNDMFKGSGMEEYCRECVNKKNIKGRWKVNKY